MVKLIGLPGMTELGIIVLILVVIIFGSRFLKK